MFGLMKTSTHTRKMLEKNVEHAFEVEQLTERHARKSKVYGSLADELLKERDAARIALRDIIAMETEHCAHIGKRMAARAREAMPTPAHEFDARLAG